METQRKKYKDDGVTLIELILVLSIMSILAAVLVPSLSEQVKKAKETVCWQNRRTLQEAYSRHLEAENVEHSQEALNEFVSRYEERMCPDGEILKYVDGEVKCSIHLSAGEIIDEDDDSDVPYL